MSRSSEQHEDPTSSKIESDAAMALYTAVAALGSRHVCTASSASIDDKLENRIVVDRERE